MQLKNNQNSSRPLKRPCGQLLQGHHEISCAKLHNDEISCAKLHNDKISCAKLHNDKISCAKLHNDKISWAKLHNDEITCQELWGVYSNQIANCPPSHHNFVS